MIFNLKISVLVSSMLLLPGFNSFGQTNVVPPAAQPVSRPALRGQGMVSTNIAGMPVSPSQPTFSHKAETTPADLARFRRIHEEGLLAPVKSRNGRNTWAATESIFRSDNDQMGDSCIRDTYVTIFPTGR